MLPQSASKPSRSESPSSAPIPGFYSPALIPYRTLNGGAVQAFERTIARHGDAQRALEAVVGKERLALMVGKTSIAAERLLKGGAVEVSDPHLLSDSSSLTS